MLVLGIILIIVGYATGISVIYSIGYVLAVIGLILLVLSFAGRPVGGRRWYQSPVIRYLDLARHTNLRMPATAFC